MNDRMGDDYTGIAIIKRIRMRQLLKRLGFHNISHHFFDPEKRYDAGLTTEQKEILDKEIIMLRLQGVTI